MVARIACLTLICWFFGSPAAQAQTILIHPAAETTSDQRYQYDWAVLQAAMQATVSQFGPFEIHEEGVGMVPKRVEFEMRNPGSHLNVFVRATSIELEKMFLPIRIPVDRGVLGYRVLIVRKADLPKFAAVRNLDDLRQFRFGQGKNWIDVQILEYAGFDVVEASNYNTLFSMLTHGRFDVLSRGIDEAFVEYGNGGDARLEIAIEPRLLLHYPLPRYFFVRRDSEGRKLAHRIEAGLEIMLRDGALVKLFNQYKLDQITQARLAKRLLLTIPNPELPPETPLSRKELWFDPFSGAAAHSKH